MVERGLAEIAYAGVCVPQEPAHEFVSPSFRMSVLSRGVTFDDAPFAFNVLRGNGPHFSLCSGDRARPLPRQSRLSDFQRALRSRSDSTAPGLPFFHDEAPISTGYRMNAELRRAALRCTTARRSLMLAAATDSA